MPLLSTIIAKVDQVTQFLYIMKGRNILCLQEGPHKLDILNIKIHTNLLTDSKFPPSEIELLWLNR